MSNNHTIHSLQHHFGWDNANKPVINIKSGETIEIDTVDLYSKFDPLYDYVEDYSE